MYGISGFSGGFGGRGVFGSNCCEKNKEKQIIFSASHLLKEMKRLEMSHSSYRLLTMFDPLLTFCGVNAGLPWLLCANGFESLLRSD